MNIGLTQLSKIAKFILENWAYVVSFLWLIQSILKIISEETVTTWDDKAHEHYHRFLKTWFPRGSNHPPIILRWALRWIKEGQLPFWMKILLRVRFGKFITPSGINYNGFKVVFKW